MVLCTCYSNITEQKQNNCNECHDLCKSNGGIKQCSKFTLGMMTEIVITLLVLSYVFFILLLYFVIKTLERCKGKPKWLSPLLLTLTILLLTLGWVPILNIILVITLIVVLMHFYTTCGIKKSKDK